MLSNELLAHLTNLGTGMGELQRGERLQIMLTDEELKVIDNWRFERRMPSRASAIRELLKRGLAAEGFDLAERGIKSEDFGVTTNGGQGAVED